MPASFSTMFCVATNPVRQSAWEGSAIEASQERSMGPTHIQNRALPSGGSSGLALLRRRLAENNRFKFFSIGKAQGATVTLRHTGHY
jgi:hypothetical protein